MGTVFIQDYDVLAREGISHSELGAMALQRAAIGLRRCLNSKIGLEDKEASEQLLEALHKNLRLWTILQVEVTSANCAMADLLRRNLLSLSRYVDTVTFQCIAKPDQARLLELIRINENLADGLSTTGDSQQFATVPVETLELSVSF